MFRFFPKPSLQVINRYEIPVGTPSVVSLDSIDLTPLFIGPADEQDPNITTTTTTPTSTDTSQLFQVTPIPGLIQVCETSNTVMPAKAGIQEKRLIFQGISLDPPVKPGDDSLVKTELESALTPLQDPPVKPVDKSRDDNLAITKHELLQPPPSYQVPSSHNSFHEEVLPPMSPSLVKPPVAAKPKTTTTLYPLIFPSAPELPAQQYVAIAPSPDQFEVKKDHRATKVSDKTFSQLFLQNTTGEFVELVGGFQKLESFKKEILTQFKSAKFSKEQQEVIKDVVKKIHSIMYSSSPNKPLKPAEIASAIENCMSEFYGALTILHYQNSSCPKTSEFSIPPAESERLKTFIRSFLFCIFILNFKTQRLTQPENTSSARTKSSRNLIETCPPCGSSETPQLPNLERFLSENSASPTSSAT